MPQSKRRLHLTDRAVRSLKAEAKYYDITDSTTSGFGVRVEPDGGKFFWVRWWDGARRARKYLGSYGEPPLLSLAKAREQAEALKVAARTTGGAKKAEPQKLTFGEAAREWLEVHSKPKKASWKEDERIVGKYLAPWSDRPAASITRRDAAQLLAPLLKEGKLVMARQVKAVISPIFVHLLDIELVDQNPVAGMKLPRSRSRERVLSDSELATLWPLWSASGVRGALFQLLVLTGLRPGEGIGAQWSDIEGNWLSIPDTKSDVPHRAYLTPQARIVLERAEAAASASLIRRTERATRKDGSEIRSQTDAAYTTSPWIFPSFYRPGQPFARANELTKTFRAASGTSGWTAHDLRRTCATGMGRLEIPEDIVDRCLNHQRDEVSATYIRARYERAMAAAWQSWAERLWEIVGELPKGRP